MNILFVCTGNTCRSAMCAAITQKFIKEKGDENNFISVSSAGIYAAEGEPASENAVRVINEFGADLSAHKATLLTKRMVEQADLVLTMKIEHKKAVLYMVPAAAGKVFTLKEYANSGTDEFCGSCADIQDPYGGSIEEYRDCANEIASAISNIMNRLF